MIEADGRSTPVERVAGLKQALGQAVRRFRFDEAQVIYAELTEQCGVDPDTDDMLPSRVMLGIFDGRVREMYQMLNDLGEDRALGLKAVCLQMMGDPLWEGMASKLAETSPDDDMRRSMQALLEARSD